MPRAEQSIYKSDSGTQNCIQCPLHSHSTVRNQTSIDACVCDHGYLCESPRQRRTVRIPHPPACKEAPRLFGGRSRASIIAGTFVCFYQPPDTGYSPCTLCPLLTRVVNFFINGIQSSAYLSIERGCPPWIIEKRANTRRRPASGGRPITSSAASYLTWSSCPSLICKPRRSAAAWIWASDP